MAELPPKMIHNGRPRDQDFAPDEILYRRVPTDLWDEDDEQDLDVDSIDLPDMSTVRSKYAHPEWARFDNGEYKHPDTGVIGFEVRHIPSPMTHLGTWTWTFSPRHVPLDTSFPHAEVWASENGNHIQARARIEPAILLRWREQLFMKIKKFLEPFEEIEVRMEPPPIE